MQTLVLDRKEAVKALLEDLKDLYGKLESKDQQVVKAMIFQSCTQAGSH